MNSHRTEPQGGQSVILNNQPLGAWIKADSAWASPQAVFLSIKPKLWDGSGATSSPGAALRHDVFNERRRDEAGGGGEGDDEGATPPYSRCFYH